MTSLITAVLASLALAAAPADPSAGPVAPRPVHLCPCDLPRPFHFGPRVPHAMFTVSVEVDWTEKIARITVPVESPLFASRGWTAQASLVIDGKLMDEGILPPGLAVPLHATMELDRVTHEACVKLVPVSVRDDGAILPFHARPDCREFVVLQPPMPHRRGLGR